MKIPFADFMPDVAETDATVAAVARNVIPKSNSYGPAPSLAAYSTTLGARCRGFCYAQRKDGSYRVFAGTATDLLELNAVTHGWDSRGGSVYALGDGQFWSFAQFGTDLIAVHENDDPQVIDIEAGTVFGDLGGSPPRARYVDVFAEYVILAHLADDPFGLVWSGTASDIQWTPGSNNSDGQSFPEGGHVQAICAAAGFVMQERTVRQMIPTPGAAEGVFQFQQVASARGTIAPYSAIKFGGSVAYLAEDGFYLNDQPIGAGKVNDYFHDLINTARIGEVVGAYDPLRPLIYWLFASGSNDTPDIMMVFNWKDAKWADWAVDAQYIGPQATPGTTLEGLDSLFATLEEVTPSLDSGVWTGGRPVFAAFDSDNRLGFFAGPPMEAILETAERQLGQGRFFASSVRPVVDSALATVRVGKRDRLADARTWGNESAMQASGECPVRSNGRYQRFRVRVPAGASWTHAQGVDVRGAGAGRR